MEIVTQRRVGLVQLIAAQVHGDLARDDDLLRTAAAEELILLDAVVLADGIDDEVDGKLLTVVEGDLVFQRILGEGERDRLFLDLREGDELIESPLQLTDIGIDMTCDIVDHVFRECNIELFCPLLKDDATDLIVRRRDRGDEPAREARLQAVFELVDILRCAVARHDDVLLLIEEVIECIEDLHLRRILGAEELHIVDQEEVQISILGTEFRHGVILDGIDQLIGESLARDEEDGKLRLVFVDVVADGVEQMRLAKAGGTVDEKRVHFLVGLIRMVGRLGDRISGLKGDLVAVAMDEGGEGVFFIDRIRQEGISLLRLAAHRRIEEGGLSELPDVGERDLIGRHRLQLGKIRRHGFLRKGIIDIRLRERRRRIFIGGIGCLTGHREGCLALRRLLFGGTGFRQRRHRRGLCGLVHDIGDLDGKLLPCDVENNFFQLSFIYIFDPWFPPLVFGRNRQCVFCHGDRKDFVGKHVIVRVVILVDIVQDLIP